jgi:3-methyladenine DNA glycosylase/8-oxoguanine DNA glycosylase
VAARRQWDTAAQELAQRHAVLAVAYERHGALAPGRPVAVDRRFAELARAIVYQQLAGKAAAAIWSRVSATVGDPFTPDAVLSTDPELLRAAGLSGAKSAAVLDLAAHVDDGRVQLARAGRMSDSELVEHLTVVRGIGPWTAQMFLIFQLGRVDVWPTGDLGVRAGFAQLFDLPATPDAKELAVLGEPYAPYRTVLAQWCWRATDGDDANW